MKLDYVVLSMGWNNGLNSLNGEGETEGSCHILNEAGQNIGSVYKKCTQEGMKNVIAY